jgi:hypothetical protein
MTSPVLNIGDEKTGNGTYTNSSLSISSTQPNFTGADILPTGKAHQDGQQPQQLHYVRRGQEQLADNSSTDSITGYDAEQMNARAALTYEEELKLLRRIDWHIMPLCAIAFFLKNLDSSNVTNARIMNTGTGQNILKQLGMSSNEFNFVSTIYYVSTIFSSKSQKKKKKKSRLKLQMT